MNNCWCHWLSMWLSLWLLLLVVVLLSTCPHSLVLRTLARVLISLSSMTLIQRWTSDNLTCHDPSHRTVCSCVHTHNSDMSIPHVNWTYHSLLCCMACHAWHAGREHECCCFECHLFDCLTTQTVVHWMVQVEWVEWVGWVEVCQVQPDWWQCRCMYVDVIQDISLHHRKCTYESKQSQPESSKCIVRSMQVRTWLHREWQPGMLVAPVLVA